MLGYQERPEVLSHTFSNHQHYIRPTFSHPVPGESHLTYSTVVYANGISSIEEPREMAQDWIDMGDDEEMSISAGATKALGFHGRLAVRQSGLHVSQVLRHGVKSVPFRLR